MMYRRRVMTDRMMAILLVNDSMAGGTLGKLSGTSSGFSVRFPSIWLW